MPVCRLAHSLIAEAHFSNKWRLAQQVAQFHPFMPFVITDFGGGFHAGISFKIEIAL